MLKGASCHILLGDKVHPLDTSYLMDLYYMRVDQQSRGSCFGIEPVNIAMVAGQLGFENFYRDLSLERFLACKVNVGHGPVS